MVREQANATSTLDRRGSNLRMSYDPISTGSRYSSSIESVTVPSTTTANSL